MKALSLTQPWATLVAIGAKTIETRSWGTAYRGTVAIHAAKGWPAWAKEECRRAPFNTVLGAAGYDRAFAPLPLGAIVAVAELTSCYRITETTPRAIQSNGDFPPHELAFGDYTPGRFAWVLKFVWRLEQPVPVRGALSLWDLPSDVLAAVTAQRNGEPAEVARG